MKLMRLHRKRFGAFTLAALVVFFILLYTKYDESNLVFVSLRNVPIYVKTGHRIVNRAMRKQQTGRCEPIEEFFFLKIHKTGSTTIQNINFRYGFQRNLTIMVPKSKYMLNFVHGRRWSYLEPPKNRRFRIITSHTVYDKDVINKILPNKPACFTIIRHPMGRLISGIYFWNVNRELKTPKISNFLRHVLKYDRYARPYLNGLQERWQRSVLINTMAYELGMPPNVLRSAALIREYVEKVSKEFVLVMILEKIDESLVMLKRLMCWELKDILVMKHNRNSGAMTQERASTSDVKRHRLIAAADYAVYDYFSRKLDRQIRKEGEDFQREVDWYKSVNTRIDNFCVNDEMRNGTVHNDTLRIEETQWNEAFSVSGEDCTYMAMTEDKFIRLIELKQYGEVQKQAVYV